MFRNCQEVFIHIDYLCEESVKTKSVRPPSWKVILIIRHADLRIANPFHIKVAGFWRIAVQA